MRMPPKPSAAGEIPDLIEELKEAGVAAVYGPGTNIPAAASEIIGLLRKPKRAA